MRNKYSRNTIFLVRENKYTRKLVRLRYNKFHEQIKQAWYIAPICKTATEPYASFENDLIDYSYQLSNTHSSLKIKWFHGDPVTLSSEEIIYANELSDDNSHW